MTAIILAGGKAGRMGGKEKAFLKLGGESLINRQLKALKKRFKKIIVVTNSPKGYARIRGITIIPDIAPGLGPLGGIYSGLLASSSFYNFVIACDMPFIDTSLIEYMRKESAGYGAIVPKINNRYEPLFCIYSKNCLKRIKQLLDKRIFKIRRLFTDVKVREISKKEIAKIVSPEKVFMNINTVNDLVVIKNRYAHIKS